MPQVVQEAMPRSSNSKRNLAATIGRNTIFGVIARVVQVATRLVTVPIVISHLGLGGYGIWSIIMTTAAYMRFGSVGVKSAFQKYVAEATGDGDFEKVNKLLSTGCAVMLILSVAGLIPIALFSTNLAKACGVPNEFLSSSASAISVLALIMVMSNVGSVYEAIVMGGHRIDLARKFTTAFTVGEAVAIVVLLHFGYGLFAMASVMATSEIGFVLSCYIASKRVVPQIRLSTKYVERSVLGELLRYVGSYQLVGILEVLYAAILPIAILRHFGADASGVYALATRLATCAITLPDAFLLPILSSGAMIYASGSSEEIRLLITKAFKVTLGLGLFPITFIAMFGATMIYAWTGESAPTLNAALWMVALASLFQTFSRLGLVLYRVSGRAVLDNVRQLLTIAILVLIAVFARRLGFYGVLGGLAAAELVGMVFMLFAITKTFRQFRPSSLLPDALRLSVATAGILAVGAIAMRIPLPTFSSARLMAALQLGKVSLACTLAIWPALWLTKSVTDREGQALVHALFPRKNRPDQRCVESVT